MKGYKRSIYLNFDYKEVTEGVPQANRALRELNSEYRKQVAEVNAADDVMGKLTLSMQKAEAAYKINSDKAAILRKELEDLESNEKATEKAITEKKIALNSAETAMANNKAEMAKLSEEIKKQSGFLGVAYEDWEKFGDKATEIGKDLTLKVTTPIVGLAAASYKMGADFEDAFGKAEVVFGRNAREIEAWSKTALKEFGLSRVTALSMATDFAAGFNQLGIQMDKSQEWSMNLTSLVTDMSAFYNTTTAETEAALTAILSGQTEPLKKFQIFMTQANLQQFAYSEGIQKNIKDMTEAEKVQLRYNYVIQQTSQAHGQFKREQDGATAQMMLFKESVKELGVSFSEHIMPMITPMIAGVNKAIQTFSELDDWLKKTIVVFAGLAASIGPIILSLGMFSKAIVNVKDGFEAVPKVISGVSKAGKAFNGLLDNTAFLGFAKWAIIITGVAVAIYLVIDALNTLLNRSRQSGQALSDISKAASGITGTTQRAFAIGTQYAPGGIARAHEYGDEIIETRRGDRIYTAEQSRQMMENMGGNKETANLLAQLINTVRELGYKVEKIPDRQLALARE